jgi:hypothetical protein
LPRSQLRKDEEKRCSPVASKPARKQLLSIDSKLRRKRSRHTAASNKRPTLEPLE